MSSNPTQPPAAVHSHLGYRPDIDGLRAIAVLGVVLFHAGFSWCKGGYAGVDVFFVISGFLITTIIEQDRRRGGFTLARFYERRARRILPALLLVLLSTALAAWKWLDPGRMAEFGASLASVMTFSSNFWFWQHTGYFGHSAEETPLLHTWSLAVEEQFYIFFPLLLTAAWRFGRRQATVMVALLFLASMLASEIVRRHWLQANFYLVATRAWELLSGALLALMQSRRPLPALRSQGMTEALVALGIGMIVASFVLYGPRTPFPSLYALLPVVGALLVIAYGGGSALASKFLTWKPMVGIGLISYSAYLWHQPVFAFARLGAPQRLSDGWMWALIALTLLLAWASWRWVEVPFRNRQAMPMRRAAAIFATASVAFVVAGLAASLADGFPGRYRPQVLALAASAVPSPDRARCHTKGRDFMPPEQACRTPGASPTWAVLGDSHAVEPAYAMSQLLAVRNEGSVQLSFSACPPALDFTPLEAGCAEWLRRSLEYVENQPGIWNVLVAFRHTAYLFGHQERVYPDIPNEEPEMVSTLPPVEARELYWTSFRAVVDRLLRAGKRVYVLLPVPELPLEVDRFIYTDRFDGPITSRDYYQRRHAFMLQHLAELPWGDRLVAVDPAATLCDGSGCRAVLDGSAMYFDDDHLSVGGALRVLAPLVEGPARNAAAAPKSASLR